MVDPDEIRARARAAQTAAERLEPLVYQAKVEAMMTRAEHLLIQHSPTVEARLRLLLEDGLAAPRRASPGE